MTKSKAKKTEKEGMEKGPGRGLAGRVAGKASSRTTMAQVGVAV